MNFLENGRIPPTRQNYVAKRRALSGQTFQSWSSKGVNNKLGTAARIGDIHHPE